MSHASVLPPWNQKRVEGKMFERMVCDHCAASFNFTESPRMTRIPRCPVCGSTGARRAQAPRGTSAA